MDDIEIFGVHYLQQISDSGTGGAIHIEPGIWLNVPLTSKPAEPPTVVRLATIPHGNSVLVQGTSSQLNGPPAVGHANTVPFPVGGVEPPPGTANGFGEYDLGTPSPFRTTPTPAQVKQAAVTNPNSVLAAAMAGQTITATTALHVSTVNNAAKHTLGHAVNIPFLRTNAEVGHVSATFWIETETAMTYIADPRVDAYIDALPGWQQAICREVRDLVHGADPEVTETIKRTRQPYFVLHGNICALLAAKDHVNVFLYDGAIVADPDRIITAGHHNKTARTVAVRQGEAINAPALTAMLRQIIANNRAGGWRKLKPTS